VNRQGARLSENKVDPRTEIKNQKAHTSCHVWRFENTSGDGFRIIAVSPFETATRPEILKFVAKHPKALIVLPGNYPNTPSRRQIQRVIRRGSVVLAEESGCPFLITRHRVLFTAASDFPKSAYGTKHGRLGEDIASAND
jgi:hypothetical protein